ncbi:MAG: hypothetical protein ABW252_06510 [Polyangiales bacterium]
MKAFLGYAACAALSILAACDDDPVEPTQDLDGGRRDAGRMLTLTCEEADLLVAASLASDAKLIAIRRCEVDADCTAHTLPTVTCAERRVSLPNCDVPVAVGSLDASVAFLGSLETVLCPRIAPDCNVGISCAPARARCVSGECTMVPGTMADAGI